MIFKTWFEYIGYLPCGVMFLIWLLSTSTGPTDHGTVQREISSTKLHKPLLTHLINYNTFSIHCIFFCIWVFIFLKITNIICLNCCFFPSIFSIKMATHILSRVKQITSPGWMHETSAWAWCTGKTQRDRVEREVGGRIGMGNTRKSMADSCQCMTKTTTIL